jgi:hypothetical protein
MRTTHQVVSLKSEKSRFDQAHTGRCETYCTEDCFSRCPTYCEESHRGARASPCGPLAVSTYCSLVGRYRSYKAVLSHLFLSYFESRTPHMAYGEIAAHNMHWSGMPLNSTAGSVLSRLNSTMESWMYVQVPDGDAFELPRRGAFSCLNSDNGWSARGPRNCWTGMLWSSPAGSVLQFELKDRKLESLKARVFGVPFKETIRYEWGVDPSATMSLTFLSTSVTASTHTLSYCNNESRVISIQTPSVVSRAGHVHRPQISQSQRIVLDFVFWFAVGVAVGGAPR